MQTASRGRRSGGPTAVPSGRSPMSSLPFVRLYFLGRYGRLRPIVAIEPFSAQQPHRGAGCTPRPSRAGDRREVVILLRTPPVRSTAGRGSPPPPPQCASSQLAPTPTSTSSGTRRRANSVISRGSSPRTRANSSCGTSRTSSSCTCIKSRVCSRSASSQA